MEGTFPHVRSDETERGMREQADKDRGATAPVVSRRFDDLGKDGAPVRLGLMGGTFDPIHIGHLRIAEEMREQLDLDAVLFIPAGNPVFKRDQNVTDAQQRFDEVAAAVRGNPHFDASRIEVDRQGDTFTADSEISISGNLTVNNVSFINARITVNGDCQINSQLEMTHENDYLLVNGNLTMGLYNNGSGSLSAGTVEVKGDFVERSENSYSSYHYWETGTHQTVFSGSDVQQISFAFPS